MATIIEIANEYGYSLSPELVGATVERVYWAVPSSDWLPVIGEPFEDYPAARHYADGLIRESTAGAPATITNRIVFRKTNGTTIDMEIWRQRLISRKDQP